MIINSINIPNFAAYRATSQTKPQTPMLKPLAYDTVSFGNNSEIPSLGCLIYRDDNRGQSTLLMRAKTPELINYLLEAGKHYGDEVPKIMLTQFDGYGDTPLMMAETPEITNALLEAGKHYGGEEFLRKMLTQNNYWTEKTALSQAKTPEKAQALIDAAPDNDTLKTMLTQQDEDERTALMLAGTPELTQTIIDAAPDEDTLKTMLTQQDKLMGRTALMLAVQNNKTEKVQTLLNATPDEDILKTMLTQQDKLMGRTALMLAVQNNKTEKVQTLLNATPDEDILKTMLTQKDNNGHIALMQAKTYEQMRILAEAMHKINLI